MRSSRMPVLAAGPPAAITAKSPTKQAGIRCSWRTISPCDVGDDRKSKINEMNARDHRSELVELAQRSSWFIAALRAVRTLQLPSWCIGAGAVRNLVWDALHGYAVPSRLADIDVAYFDANPVSAQRDHEAQAQLEALLPGAPWEVTNQAFVHLWFESVFGHPVAPLHSLEDAVSSWPEFATCVGLRLEPDDALTVIAPYGLDDLFSMVIRRNPARVSVRTYRERIERKRYAERWPAVTIVPC